MKTTRKDTLLQLTMTAPAANSKPIRRFMKTLPILVAFISLCAAAFPSPSTRSPKPNVVFIFIDSRHLRGISITSFSPGTLGLL